MHDWGSLLHLGLDWELWRVMRSSVVQISNAFNVQCHVRPLQDSQTKWKRFTFALTDSLNTTQKRDSTHPLVEVIVKVRREKKRNETYY